MIQVLKKLQWDIKMAISSLEEAVGCRVGKQPWQRVNCRKRMGILRLAVRGVTSSYAQKFRKK